MIQPERGPRAFAFPLCCMEDTAKVEVGTSPFPSAGSEAIGMWLNSSPLITTSWARVPTSPEGQQGIRRNVSFLTNSCVIFLTAPLSSGWHSGMMWLNLKGSSEGAFPLPRSSSNCRRRNPFQLSLLAATECFTHMAGAHPGLLCHRPRVLCYLWIPLMLEECQDGWTPWAFPTLMTPWFSMCGWRGCHTFPKVSTFPWRWCDGLWALPSPAANGKGKGIKHREGELKRRDSGAPTF